MIPRVIGNKDKRVTRHNPVPRRSQSPALIFLEGLA
jgi:hypothetical protein